MATFWERATHSVFIELSLFCIILILVISYCGFEGGTFVLITSVPGHCLCLTFLKNEEKT